ncbi:MAG: hypothetical protein A2Y33_14150 [Spirochaetes bacterium GWF1_51_8]|nr:MAG: hypothetical protein A2Y33_14150 [Spirochaetes bacterium GWF1_51_8]
MKITSGEYKGRNILVPEHGVKPTSEKVRQAVMSILRPVLAGASVLDIFCGTGAVGIEALSNGAAVCCFIDHNFRVLKLLKQNLDTIVADPSRYRVLKHNCTTFVDAFSHDDELPVFDIVFADPFYDDTRTTFERIYENVFRVLKPGGVFIIEHGEKCAFSEYPYFTDTRNYGDTWITTFIYRKAEV